VVPALEKTAMNKIKLVAETFEEESGVTTGGKTSPGTSAYEKEGGVDRAAVRDLDVRPKKKKCQVKRGGKREGSVRGTGNEDTPSHNPFLI